MTHMLPVLIDPGPDDTDAIAVLLSDALDRQVSRAERLRLAFTPGEPVYVDIDLPPDLAPRLGFDRSTTRVTMRMIPGGELLT